MFNRRVLAGVLAMGIAALFAGGCSAPRMATKSLPTAGMLQRDTVRAKQFFVDGAIYDLRQEYADGILEYLEALKYSDAPAIYYCIAKDYFALHRANRAAEYADSAIAGDSNNTVYRSLRAEIALTMQGDFDEAQYQLERIITQDSDDVQALSDLAGIYQLKGRNSTAISLYNRILDINGYDAEVSLHLAQAYNETGELKKSVDALKDVLEDDPSNIPLRETIAQTYMQTNQFDSAVSEYNDLLERFPCDAGVEFDLANVYAGHNQWQKAFPYYKHILADDSLNKDTLDVVLDTLYTHISVDTASLEVIAPLIAQAARRDTANWYARELEGGVLLYRTRETEAMILLKQSIRSAGSDTLAALLSGAEILMEHQQSRDLLSLVADVPVPPDFRISILKAYAYQQLKNIPAAISALYESLQLNPRNFMTLGDLGMNYDEEHNAEKSDSAYEAALALKPDYAVVLNNYSYSLAERGENLPRAKTMSQKAVALDTENASYLDTYGWVFYKLGQYDSALVWLSRAVRNGDTPPTVLEHIGDAEYKSGNCTEALRRWNEALRKDDANDALKQKILGCGQRHDGD